MQKPRLSLRERRQNRKSAKAAKLVAIEAEGVPSSRQIFSELLIIFGVIALIVTIFLWWHYIVSNPQRVFHGMLNNTLQTYGANINTSESTQGQTLFQRTDFRVNGQHVVNASTSLNQGTSKAETETIGTPSEDYVKYTNVDTNQLNANGKPLDFSHVLNVWAKSANSGSTQTNGQLYNQIILGVIPFANLNEQQRASLLKQSSEVYNVDYNVVQKTIVNGRPQYTYRVQVMPEPYVKMLKEFAAYTGLNQLETLDPAQYAGAAPLTFSATVDVWSRQLKSLTYGSSDRQEIFSAWGKVAPPLQLPSNPITVEELQNRLQTIQ